MIDVTSRLNPLQARKLLSEILNAGAGNIYISRHGYKQIKSRDLELGDIFNVLKVGQIHSSPEFCNGSWRYRVQTRKITVVIAFMGLGLVAMVTAWRNEHGSIR